MSLRLGSLMQQGKTKMYRARKDGRWGDWGLCSMATSSELGQCSLVSPTVSDRGQQSKLRDCTERTDGCFPSRKHWGLGSTVQKLRLGRISGGVRQGPAMVPGLHTRKASCV